MMETIQSVVFDRNIHNLNKCLHYLKYYRYKTEMWATPNHFFFQQHEPTELQKYDYREVYNGVYLVKGYGKKNLKAFPAAGWSSVASLPSFVFSTVSLFGEICDFRFSLIEECGYRTFPRNRRTNYKVGKCLFGAVYRL